jgi:hypothetical protein
MSNVEVKRREREMNNQQPTTNIQARWERREERGISNNEYRMSNIEVKRDLWA